MAVEATDSNRVMTAYAEVAKDLKKQSRQLLADCEALLKRLK